MSDEVKSGIAAGGSHPQLDNPWIAETGFLANFWPSIIEVSGGH